MKLFRSIDSIDMPDHGCVMTIGNYDAVHIGHQQILKRLRKKADQLDLPMALMTFDPHPEEYFLGDRSAPRLTNAGSRFFALREHGVDLMLMLPFNRKLASTTAEDFINRYLVEAMNVQYLLIGDDFRFGKNRAGDFDLLGKASALHGFEVENSDTILFAKERVSSSRIRTLLERGEMELAAGLLGRRYTMSGKVIRGQQLGRQWGFPTLNIAINHTPAVTGVFAVEVKGLGQAVISGVANLGTRPTVDGLKTLLEVHLFDFDQVVYGQRICVEFVEKIRSEKKFDSFDALKTQIMQDAKKARTILEAH